MRKVIIAFLLIIAIAGMGGVWFVHSIPDALDPDSTEEITVEIPEGYGINAIGELLEEQGVISSAFKFKLYNRLSGDGAVLNAGTYTLSPSMDLPAIFEKLSSYEVDSMSFTIPEGLTLYQTAEKLADQGMGSYEEFLRAIQNVDFGYGWLENNSLEGYLLPNTYTVPDGYTEEQIIDFLLEQFEQTVLPIYDSADQALKDKYTLNEIITAASIIERECMKDDERPLVASVIYNRMDENMKLEMCSTIQYLLLMETGEVKENLLYSDLEIESPYNTYLHFGLPPGPICSPGIASIKAALEPADTDYLYFVVSADLDGSSKFSSNYDDFLDYKDEYYEAWNAANANN
jgi:UPF0755 protein